MIVRGWRVFPQITGNGGLRGKWAAVWETKKMQAVCDPQGGNQWAKGPRAAARCRAHLMVAGSGGRHGMCNCGLFGVWKLGADVTKRFASSVLAQCVFWGAAQIGNKGIRAEWARIEIIYIPAGAYDRHQIMDAYNLWAPQGVRVVVMPKRGLRADGDVRLNAAYAALPQYHDPRREELHKFNAVESDLGARIKTMRGQLHWDQERMNRESIRHVEGRVYGFGCTCQDDGKTFTSGYLSNVEAGRSLPGKAVARTLYCIFRLANHDAWYDVDLPKTFGKFITVNGKKLRLRGK